MLYFSASSSGFYDGDIHGSNKPSDVVEITEAEHAALLAAQTAGLVIVGDAGGRPVAVERVVTDAERTANLRAAALTELKRSDVTVLRCAERAVAVPNNWLAYRDDLRAIVSGTSAVTELPARPEYPAGT